MSSPAPNATKFPAQSATKFPALNATKFPAQVLVVFLAFALMIVLSYLFVSDLEYKNMVKNAEDALSHTEAEIEANLLEPETFLGGLSETVRHMILQGDSVDRVTAYIQHVTGYLLGTRDNVSGFHGANGFFEVFADKFISGHGWQPPDTYVPQDRPWYKAAVAADGAVTVTDPFVDMLSGSIIITFARRIFDDAGRPLGVLCIDINLDRLSRLVLDMRLAEGGYGILLNKGLVAIAHPDQTQIGKTLHDVNIGVLNLMDELERGTRISERRVKNYQGEEVVVFFRQIKYGWYMGIITPEDKYYQTTRNMAFILIVLGTVLALIVSAILLRINAAKNKADVNLQQQTVILTTLLDSIPDHVFIKDLNFQYIQCNKSLLQHHGLRREDLIGKDDREGLGVPEEIAAVFRDGDQKIINENRIMTNEEYVPNNRGDNPLHSTLKAPLVVNGSIIGVLGISHDITKYKEAERILEAARNTAEAANRSKTSFLANMSHEIRTPMNSIIGFSELALDDKEISGRTKEYLDNISQSAKWLLALINDILDISKIEAGKMEIEHIPFDLHEIFSHCQSIIQPKAVEKGISLYCYAEPSVGKKLLGDPLRLRQALINLLSNAVKFTNVGMVKLLASVEKVGENKVKAHFEVKDSGIGMSKEQIEKIFQPFVQADESITRKYGGTGLGLPITCKIIEMMGGELHVESAPGVGSKFSYELIFDTIDYTSNTSFHTVVSRNIEKPNFTGEVLVCEDNHLNQRVLCEHLSKVGLRTVVAGNGEDGVAVIENRIKNNEKPFDLILMDIHMPVMDGLEAASKIAGLGVKTPIVAVTANIMSNDLELYRSSGMFDWLGKPFTSQTLWACLMKYIPVTGTSSVDKRRDDTDNEKLLKELQLIFVKSNQTKINEIAAAVAEGEIKTANRLAHTLKGNAGQIGEKRLQEAAAVTESMLLNGENRLEPEQLDILEAELKMVLDKLAPLLAEANAPADPLSKEQIIELFDKLEPLLVNRKPACMELLDDVLKVPGAEELARQIENMKFKQAAATLAELKKGQMV
ncbi:MAG: response regulator [Treponema sp.]|jgi:PAS domain S-box-containing protein|nr:response regulator [Treponema sp.]